MAPESVDVEMAVLAAISSDRYLLEKVLDEGFHPQLLHSPIARLIADTLAALREQSLNAVDPIIVKSKLEEHGQFSPQVKEYMETMSARSRSPARSAPFLSRPAEGPSSSGEAAEAGHVAEVLREGASAWASGFVGPCCRSGSRTSGYSAAADAQAASARWVT